MTMFQMTSLRSSKSIYLHWVVAAAIVVLYLSLLYGVYVPDGNFILTSADSTLTILRVPYEVRGDIGPACNAVVCLYRTILGLSHLYQRPMFRRTPVGDVVELVFEHLAQSQKWAKLCKSFSLVFTAGWLKHNGLFLLEAVDSSVDLRYYFSSTSRHNSYENFKGSIRDKKCLFSLCHFFLRGG